MQSRRLIVATMALAGMVGIPAVPASATHPCARSADGTSYDAVFTADHDACGGGLPAAQPGDVTVSLSDSGATVTVPLGGRLLVSLDSRSLDAPVWSEVDAGGALFRRYLDVQRPQTSAVFEASRPTVGEQVVATGPTPWSVTVVVPAGSRSPSPSPSPSCTSTVIPASQAGALVLTEADDGRTVQVDLGDKVGVFYRGCVGSFDFRPAVATGPLRRYRARGNNPGGASAVFATSATGTAAITSTTDVGCMHTSPACLPPQRQWKVMVQVVQRCELTGPASVPVGSAVQLHGRFRPGATVQIYFRPYGGTGFTVRRTLTADADGGATTSYRALVDQRWYATGSPGCTSPSGLTRIAAQIFGPAAVRRGTSAQVVVHGPAGAVVQVWFQQPDGRYVRRRSARLDSAGAYRTSYVADRDRRYYAVTGPDGRTTSPMRTAVR